MAAHIQIGPCRLADGNGTHEPGDVVIFPTPALIALAEAGTCDPESGLPYCTVYTPPALQPAPVAAPAPAAPAVVNVKASDITTTKEADA